MKRFVLTSLAAAGVLALGACAPVEGRDTSAVPDASTPQACRVADYQSYVGRNRSAVPADAPQGMTFRVLCTTCAATMDYNPSRVNFVYESATNIIREVRCG